MKLRLKGEVFAKQVLTEFDSNSVTVAELKLRIRDILQLHDENEEFLRSIQFSLNGKQALLAEDTELVSNLGFVSGDAVFVLGIYLGIRKPKVPRLNPSANENYKKQEYTPLISDKQHIASLGFITESKIIEERSDQSREEPNGNSETLNIKKHHMPLLDTPNMLVPQSYQTLIASNFQNIPFESNLEKLAGILHILMIETGFQPQTLKSFSDPFSTLPDLWKVVNETVRLNYKTASQSSATLLLSSVASLVIVHGIGSSVGKSVSLKLKPSEFMPPVGGKRLRKVCIDFKNEIAFPLYVYIEREANGTCPTHFANLPPEISYNILQRIDSKSLCRLSMTCQVFDQLASQPSLWRKLALKEFGKKISNRTTSDIKNWKELYKNEYILEKKQQEVSKTVRGYTTTRSRDIFLAGPCNRPHVYPDVNGGHEFPGVVGGYSDLYPDLRGFGPPGRRLPSRNLPDEGLGFPRPFGKYRGFPHI